MEERIYSAAIWYKELPLAQHNSNNVDCGVVVAGHRHADIIKTVLNLTGKRTVRFGDDSVGVTIQGFVTNKNRFVDRKEAAQIAKDANQIINPHYNVNCLYSEDIY